MKTRIRRWLALTIIALVVLSGFALAEGAITTTVVMRVSHLTQNAVVDAGEDLSIDVIIDGVTPDSYRWYFAGEAIPGADQQVLNIVNAQPENTGTYRMDAFDAEGNMLVSMDIAVRVIDKTVPQSGDSSMPVGYAFAGIALCGALLMVLMRRRATI